MSEYKVLARKYRPQRFQEVVGQQAIVTTLKNAMQRNTLAHAYLFCGARGTGKTTLARLFAKALNCLQPGPDLEPCNLCPSCSEINSGSCLDVLEIDGASHRGIDDIRQINETVNYATAHGKYKIYIIDEVHMLTKEAFNALLKTLEEPPHKVKFLFATTEPHKVLPTILSRCQRFNLRRIATADIVQKLLQITREMQVEADKAALRLIAHRAEGGLRDAESLLDQVLAYRASAITEAAVVSALGLVETDLFFALDQAGKEGRLAYAFEMADQLFSQGMEYNAILDGLTEHFRNLMVAQLSIEQAGTLISLSQSCIQKYKAHAALYSKEQCLTILDFLVEVQAQKMPSSGRITLEAILLRILRSHQRIPIELLVRKLAELEQKDTPEKPVVEKALPELVEKPVTAPSISVDPTPTAVELGARPTPEANQKDMQEKPVVTKAPPEIVVKPVKAPSISVDPTPTAVELGARPTPEAKQKDMQQQVRYDTMLQFAAVELEGTVQKMR